MLQSVSMCGARPNKRFCATQSRSSVSKFSVILISETPLSGRVLTSFHKHWNGWNGISFAWFNECWLIMFLFEMNTKRSDPALFFFQAEDGIRDRSPSRGLGDVYKRQLCGCINPVKNTYCLAWFSSCNTWRLLDPVRNQISYHEWYI